MTQMKSYLSQLKNNGLNVILSGIFISFFAQGHAVLSISIIAFVLFSFLFISKNKEFYRNDWMYISLMLFYLWIVFSGIWSQDTFYFFQKMNLKSALIGVAFSFFWLPNISLNQFENISKIIIFVFVLSTLVVMYEFIQNHFVVSQNIMKGQPLWVPMRSHIRYGLLINFCFLLTLFFSNYYHSSNVFKHRIYSALALYLFLFIHFLSVRSAILALYISLFCFGIFWIQKTRKYLKALCIFFGMLLAMYYLMFSIPTLSRKIGYMKWDIQEFLANSSNKYSDGSRWHSIQVGAEIFKNNYLVGVGEGDMKQAISNLTGIEKGDNTMLPHNEFVYIMASNGFVGLGIILFVFLYSLAYSWQKKQWLPFAYTSTMIGAFMVEPMLETQLGVLVFVLPFCLFHKIEFAQ